MRTLLLLLTVMMISPMAWSQDPLETKAQSIDKKLIAPCCWTATLDQHFSQEAEEMKTEIRERLSQGESEKQILSRFESKFGERILSEPKTSGFNLTVWLFPGIILLAGLAFLINFLGHQKKPALTLDSPTPMDPQDEKYRKQIDKELYRS